jgi:hypothetical protein
MYRQPEGYYRPDGELKECDICGFGHRHWRELKLQNGFWKCERCVDEEVRRRRRGRR